MESGYPLDDSEQRFDSLPGLYDVSYVKTKRARDNPVGGKWTRKSGLAQKILKTFERVQSQELPRVLSDEFNQKMNRVIRELDSQIAATADLPVQWLKVIHPLVGEGIRKSVDQLNSQIDSLELPPDATGIEEAFYQKKEEMKTNLKQKYQEFLTPPEGAKTLP